MTKIIPTNRLLFWTAVIYLPFAALLAAMPGTAPLCWGVMGGVFILVAADAARALRNGGVVRVVLPEIVRLSSGRDGEISLRIQNEHRSGCPIRIGLPFPREIHTPYPELSTRMPDKGFSIKLLWPCRAGRQGRYPLDVCYLELPSPLGFWAKRSSVPIRTEIRVYPNLFVERKNLAALFTNQHLGIHTQRQVGKGRDFEQLREYLPGDNFEDIHWKATAKRGHPITKMYQIERTQEVYVIIDGSRLSRRRPERFQERSAPAGVNGAATVLERYVIAALIMGLAAQQQGDLFGLLTFADTVKRFVRAKGGKAHYDACRDTLYTLAPQAVTPDFSELFTFIGNRIRRRALLVFLTHLDDPVLAESFVRHLDLIAKRHLILVNMLKPSTARPLFSDASVHTVDDLYGNLGGHLLWTSLRETGKILHRRNIGFALLDNERMCADLVSQYLSIKQRQLL